MQCQNLRYSSPERLLFTGLQCVVNYGDVVALTGKSGVGKSTLLQIIRGVLAADEGTVTLPQTVRVSFLPQMLADANVDDTATLRELFFRARGLDGAETELEKREQQLAGLDDARVYDRAYKLFAQALEHYESLGGFSAEADIGRILTGLGLTHDGHIGLETPLSAVSSGQRTRILLGQALFARADLLLLDDPTSHLDAASVAWLAENLLVHKKRGVLMATNNTVFMQKCATKVVEITDFGRVLVFNGSYNEFLAKRDGLLEAERTAAQSIKRRHDQLEATYKDFASRQIFARSQDMAQVGRALQTRITRLDTEFQAHPGSQLLTSTDKIPQLIFTPHTRSGNDVLTARDVTVWYGSHKALDVTKVLVDLKRGERFRLSGVNGSGKSTLMRLLASSCLGLDVQPTTGTVELGVNVEAAYYAPDFFTLPPDGEILKYVHERTRSHQESEAVSALVFWGFGKQSLRTKKIAQLSMGEKKQLQMACLMVQRPNLLLLDEPTDHLKPEVVERMVSAIKAFDGTVVFISHDSVFAKKLGVTRELKLPKQELIVYR